MKIMIQGGVLVICFFVSFWTKSFSQSLVVEAGYTRIATEAGFDSQLNFNRYFSNRFGILANVTYAVSKKPEENSTFQLGFASGLFFQIFDFQHHLLLTEAGAGTSYYEPKKSTFPFFYWSLDYFYKISSRHFVGISAGLNGGEHSAQFINVNYLFNTYSKDKNFAQRQNHFVLMGEPTLLFTKRTTSVGLNIIGAYEIGNVVSLGIGSGFVYWQGATGVVPLFADIRLYFLPGKIRPYSVFRFGYNFGAELGAYRGFGDIGIGVNAAIHDKHGISADFKLRKNQSIDELKDQPAIFAIGYIYSF